MPMLTQAGAASSAGDFRLFQDGRPAPILVDPGDFDVVQIAAGHLAADVERVFGKPSPVIMSGASLSGHVILAGTLGHSTLIDTLVEQGKLDITGLDGLWETFWIGIVDQPLAGVERGLVIVGSDRRGTAYGTFQISEWIGVSPWYWWADVPPARLESFVLGPGVAQVGPPAVKYRGIFINDEDWSLRPWASRTFAPEEAAGQEAAGQEAGGQEGFGPKTYAKIFELLLRLRANLLWPAMHPGTRPFNDYPENKVMADRYAIVMGSSHCEPMLRNNVGEWDPVRHGEWNFKTNRNTMLAYWTDRVRENGAYENIYTLGMRGIHDDPMPGGELLDERVSRVSQAITAQREILRQWARPDVETIPQILCVYKEVLDLYRGGLELPADVTTVWSDDNYGYITNLPSAAERAQGRKSGIYYHISYWGRPYDYLWLCTTPLALIWSEMHKAYACGARDVWVVNVGGLKAHEIGMEYFLRLAWNADTWDAGSPHEFLTRWAAREFGGPEPEVIADLLTEYYRLGFIRKPEHMGWNRTYPDTQNRLSEFNPAVYGDELQHHLDAYTALVQRLETIYADLPGEKRDAFYELVLYPARGASLMNQKFLYAQKSLCYAAQGRVSAARYAERARRAFDALHQETAYYNHLVANGKWRHVMCDQPRNLPVFAMSLVCDRPQPLPTRFGVVVEGAELPGQFAGQQATNSVLPGFDGFTRARHFIDLYNTGEVPFAWTAQPSVPWVLLSTTSGLLESEQRIWVEIDWETAPHGESVRGDIVITGGGETETVRLHVFHPEWPVPEPGIYESNGCVSIHAAHSTAPQTSGQASVQVIPGLGRTGEAVAVLPFADRRPYEPVELEYRMFLMGGGDCVVYVYCLPTHPLHTGDGLRYRVAFDDEPAQVVDVSTRGGEHDRFWQENVLRGAAIGHTRHKINRRGWYVLKIGILDPGVVLDFIAIDTGGQRPSYLGPTETVMYRIR